MSLVKYSLLKKIDMGTLFNQSPRNFYRVSNQELINHIENFQFIADKTGITYD